MLGGVEELQKLLWFKAAHQIQQKLIKFRLQRQPGRGLRSFPERDSAGTKSPRSGGTTGGLWLSNTRGRKQTILRLQEAVEELEK